MGRGREGGEGEEKEEWSRNNRELLELSLKVAKERVVVKRPKAAKVLGGEEKKGEKGEKGENRRENVRQPHTQVKGKHQRFDVYHCGGDK